MARSTVPFLVSTLAASALASAVACHTGSGSTPSADNNGDAEAEGGMPFQADSATVYVAKVKNLLVGLPPSDAEIQAVESDPTQIGPLIDGWMQLPQYQQKMLRFFQLAFQQTQVTYTDFADLTYPKQIAINPTTIPLLMQNAQESFARTMLQLIANGQPLTQAPTTTQFMMTTAMKELYAFLDQYEVDDDSTVTDAFKVANPKQMITIEAAQGPIPFAESIDPTSPNFMHWYDPDVSTSSSVAGCSTDPVVLGPSSASLHYLLYGSIDGRKDPSDSTINCPPVEGTAAAPQLQTGDFSDWTLVTLRPPNAGESTATFYDLPTLRQATTLVLKLPRVGFFSTPAFAANWQTNTSNTMRVTTNQSFIVALGSMVDGTDTTTPPGTPGLDTVHASQAACYSCHKILDPSRSILAATWSWNYGSQLDTTYSQQPGVFAFRGVITPVKSIADFGNALATHPYFAPGWVQKLCYYVNSSACDADDPVFKQVVSDFTSSNYSWNGLVKELLASPIVTNAVLTTSASTNGEIVAVSRRDHFCAALNARLGFADVCGLTNLYAKGTASTQTIPEIVSGLPSDGYGRGAVAPVLPNQPTLFFRAATENICESVATQVIDVATAKQVPGVMQWSSSQSTAAITDFVGLLMGLTTSDPRTVPATALLQQHYQSALQQKGTTPTQALQSTFIVACLAPTFVSIGM
jgi:hypothetical protein